jgi:chemotaxis protein CheD
VTARPVLVASGRPAGHGDGDPLRLSVYLHAGQVYASAEPSSVVTVLGSCVAVCLFDPAARVGGMNHYLLPLETTRERSARFGNFAIRRLLEEVLALGARRGGLHAKVFGGASVVRALEGRSLGGDNADLALRLLREAGVPILEQDVGGQKGRKLIFHTDDGSAWVRHL